MVPSLMARRQPSTGIGGGPTISLELVSTSFASRGPMLDGLVAAPPSSATRWPPNLRISSAVSGQVEVCHHDGRKVVTNLNLDLSPARR